MLLGIFNTITEALQFLQKKEPVPGDRIIILWSEQTTHEYDWSVWKNINGIYLKGEKGQSWLDGKDGKNAKEIDTVSLFSQLYEKLKLDDWFAKKVKGEKGEKGETGEKWKTWTPWETPDSNKIISVIYEKLRSDQEFIKSLKWKEWYTPVKGTDYFDGKPGDNWKTPIPWKDFPIPLDGRDGWEIVVIDNPNDINLDEKQLGIWLDKSIYLNRRWTILKI
jgi:hypothetical protein